MRRMTAREIAYYAERQREADERTEKKAMCHSIVALTAVAVTPVICLSVTEITYVQLGIFTVVVAAALYFICKV